MPSLTDLVNAIIRKEGARPDRNNPGNLRTWGSVPVVGGYAKFSSYADGLAALTQQANKNVFTRGLTLREFFAGQRDANGNVIPGGYSGYAPAKDSNNPILYAQQVAQWIGAPSIDVPVKDFLNGSGAAVNPTRPASAINPASGTKAKRARA